MKRVYTTGEAAALCGLSLSTVKRWIKRGALRAYRTPGGDLRIPYENLCDFMREYDIPVQNLESEEIRVLVCMRDIDQRRQFVRKIHDFSPSARVETAESEMELGFALGDFQPLAVIFERQNTWDETSALCARIRKCRAPETVRIGLMRVQEGEEQYIADRPDAVLSAPASSAEIEMFIRNLLEASANCILKQTA